MKAFANRAMAGLLVVVGCCLLAAHPALSGTPSYPAWAASVVPVYPNALPESGLVVPNIYGMATTDPFEKVVAWYKSRVQGAWTDAEEGNTWQIRTGGIHIQISRNYFDGNEKPGTRVAITTRAH